MECENRKESLAGKTYNRSIEKSIKDQGNQ